MANGLFRLHGMGRSRSGIARLERSCALWRGIRKGSMDVRSVPMGSLLSRLQLMGRSRSGALRAERSCVPCRSIRTSLTGARSVLMANGLFLPHLRGYSKCGRCRLENAFVRFFSKRLFMISIVLLRVPILLLLVMQACISFNLCKGTHPCPNHSSLQRMLGTVHGSVEVMAYFRKVRSFDQEMRRPTAMAPIVSPEQRQRAKRLMMELIEQGTSVQQARSQSAVPMHRTTVYRLLKRVQTDGENAYTDGRHGHPVKVRGEVRTFLIESCQATLMPSSTQLQQAIEQRFSLRLTVSQLNRVRASLGLTYHRPS